MKTLEYDTYCSICGLAITRQQVGACIECDTIDFIHRCYADLSIHVCVECWMKITSITCAGMDEAVIRSETLKEVDAECMRK